MVGCSVLGCSSRSERKIETITFHRFPPDEYLKNRWIKSTGRTNWQPSKYTRICSIHFQPECFKKTKNYTFLVRNALPTLHFGVSKHKATSFSQLSVTPNTSAAADKAPDMAQTPRKRKLCEKLKQKEALADSRRKKLVAVRAKNWRLNKKVAELSTIIEKMKTKSLINQETADLLLSVKPQNKDLLKRIMGVTNEKKYSPELRKFALSLHFISPRAYDYVRNTFDTCLPHPRTIIRWYQSVDGEPGFSKESLEALKLLCKNSTHQLYGALSFDEMAIRKCVEWDGNNYIGFVNSGNNVNSDVAPIANEALVFMLTCVNGSWKIPMGYFNINGISAEQKAALVRQCLDLIEECGIHVVSVTFDGCPANLSMARVLGCTINENGIVPLFNHNEKEVVIFPDPSHMLKLIRNCLGDKKTITSPDGKIISWEYVQKLTELQENEGFRLANKLTNSHVHFRKQVMKVKLAAQVLSASVADALEFCRDELKLEEFKECAATVEFIRNFNALFDIMNSRNLRAFEYKRPLSERNIDPHRKFLNSMYDYIKSLKLDDYSILDCKRKTGFLGFMICIKSILALYDKYVETKQITFLSAYKLSQDHLECFFSAIRARGGFNNNPTAKQFRSSFKRLLVHGEIKHITTANCVALEDINILTCTQPEIALNNSTSGHRCIEINEREANMDDSMIISRDHDYLADPTMITEFSRQVIIYIAGFVIRNLEATIKCQECMSALSSPTRYNSLQLKKDKGGLKYPAKDVIYVCNVAENVYRRTKTFKQQNPLQYLLQECMKNCISLNLFPELSTHFHEQSSADSHYPLLIKCICKKYLNTRIHHATKKMCSGREKVRNFYTKLILFKGQ